MTGWDTVGICTEKGCFGFQWIGQPFTHCDGCGEPYWDHTHDETIRNGRVFRKVITDAEARATYRKWGPS